jgi:hypothetical protein
MLGLGLVAVLAGCCDGGRLPQPGARLLPTRLGGVRGGNAPADKDQHVPNVEPHHLEVSGFASVWGKLDGPLP